MKKISRIINGERQEVKQRALSPLPINDDLADDIINVMPNIMDKINQTDGLQSLAFHGNEKNG